MRNPFPPRVCLCGLAVAALLSFLPCNRAAAQSAPRPKLNVYLEETDGVNQFIAMRARALAGEILSGAGVQVRWRFGKPAPGHAPERAGCPAYAPVEIAVRLTTREPGRSHPGAFGYAVIPAASGARVTILYDRVEAATAFWSPLRRPVFLAHVLVHEIAHVLHGAAAGHSTEGMMKGRWSWDDMNRMQTAPLPFTAEDVQLLRARMSSGICEAQTE